jgi:hypothetical protein
MIYIDPEDDLTNVRSRLEGVESRYVTLVIPAQTQLRSHVAWKLLHARARELGKDILIVSADPQIRSVAQAVKFRVANSLEAAQENKPRPATRPGRSTTPTKGRSTLSRSTPTRSRQLQPSEPWPSARPAHSSQGLQQQSDTPQRDDNSLTRRRDPIPSSNFGADERAYGRSYDYRIDSSPIHSLAGQQIEDPDLLVEDFQQAEDIREAASQQGHDEPDNFDPSSFNTTSRRGNADAFRITPRPQSADPFSFMDEQEINSSGKREQHAQAGLHNYDTNQHAIEDVSDPSATPIENAIEFEGDQGDFVIHSDIAPKAKNQHSWTEPTPDDEEDFVGPARTYGVRPRGSRSGQVPPLPRQQNIESEDALPPVEERPTQTGRTPRTSKSLAGSRSDPLTPRTSKPLPGSRSDALSPRVSKPLPGSRSDSFSPHVSKPLPGSRSGVPSSRASKPLPGSRSDALSPRVSKPLPGSRSDALRAAPLDNRTEMQAPLRERPRPSQPLKPQAVLRHPAPPSRVRPAASAAPAQPRPQHAPASSAKRRGLNLSGGIVIVTAVILVFILVALIAYLVPTANVRVGLPGRSYSHPVQLTMTNAHSTTPGVLSGTPFTHYLSLKGTGTASGTASVGTAHAQGQVIFTNNSTTTSAHIPTGVVITTSTNIQFVTMSDAVASPKGGNFPNTVFVPVQAVKAGTIGNVPPDSITTIPDDSITLIATNTNTPASTIQLSVLNSQAITGGGAGNAPQVKQQDLNAAQATLSTQLQANFMAWLKTQIGPQDVVGLLTKSEKLANQPQVGQILPSGTNTFSLELQATYSVLVLRNSDLQNATREQLNTDLTKEKTFSNYTMANDASISITKPTIKSSGPNQIITFNATGSAVPAITADSVKNQIIGKNISDARSTLQSSIQSVAHTGTIQVDITTSPSFIPWIPFRGDNIQVHFFATPGSTTPPGSGSKK